MTNGYFSNFYTINYFNNHYIIANPDNFSFKIANFLLTPKYILEKEFQGKYKICWIEFTIVSSTKWIEIDLEHQEVRELNTLRFPRWLRVILSIVLLVPAMLTFWVFTKFELDSIEPTTNFLRIVTSSKSSLLKKYLKKLREIRNDFHTLYPKASINTPLNLNSSSDIFQQLPKEILIYLLFTFVVGQNFKEQSNLNLVNKYFYSECNSPQAWEALGKTIGFPSNLPPGTEAIRQWFIRESRNASEIKTTEATLKKAFKNPYFYNTLPIFEPVPFKCKRLSCSPLLDEYERIPYHFDILRQTNENPDLPAVGRVLLPFGEKILFFSCLIVDSDCAKPSVSGSMFIFPFLRNSKILWNVSFGSITESIFRKYTDPSKAIEDFFKQGIRGKCELNNHRYIATPQEKIGCFTIGDGSK